MAKAVLLAGRGDGLGARALCFLAASTIAAKEGLELRYYWSHGHPQWTRHGVDGSLGDIYPSRSSSLYSGDLKSDPLWGRARTFTAWNVPHLLPEIRHYLGSLEVAEGIREVLETIEEYDFSIHARLGDISAQPLYWGSTKFFPKEGYLNVIRSIVDEHGLGARLFLASNDPSIVADAKAILPSLVTESDLLRRTGFVSATGIVKLWLTAYQLGTSKNLVAPQSAFSLLSMAISRRQCETLCPAEFLGIQDFYDEINLLWGRHALELLASDRATASTAAKRIESCLRPLGYTMKSVSELVDVMKPQAQPYEMIRVGGNQDGAYLLPDDLDGIKACFSPGVFNRKDFEDELVIKYGIACHMCDFSSDPAKFETPLIEGQTFVKRWLDIPGTPDSITLEDWIKCHAPDPADDLLLQMDIEGAEYRNLLSTPDHVLRRFRIILLELHRMGACKRSEDFRKELGPLLRRLSEDHVCIHAHPNNCCGDFVLPGSGINIPNVIELTFLRRDRLCAASNASLIPPTLPHPLDIPFNVASKPPLFLNEHWLGSVNRSMVSEMRMIDDQINYLQRSREKMGRQST